MTEITRPLPTDRSGLYAPFYDGLAAGELRIQQCASCASTYWPPRTMCLTCHAMDMSWVQASPIGEVYTFSVYYRAFHPFFQDKLPYAVASVKTDKGPIVFGEYGGADVEALAVGDIVEAEFFDGGGGFTLLRWVPRSTATDTETEGEKK